MLKRFHKLAKVLAVFALLFVIAGFVAPYFRADYFSSRIQAGLEHSLGRKVKIGDTRYNLFQGPGFEVAEVTIAEDSRIGIEPIAHVTELQARVDVLSLLKGQIRFSNLRMVEPTVNLARASDAGPWNVALLLDRADASQLPPIQIRDGRVNFKFGERKVAFYLGAADLDVTPTASGVQLAVSAEPFRNDMPARSVGRILLRTAIAGGRIDGEIEGERASIVEIVKLLGVADPGLKGFISTAVQLRGTVDELTLSGEVKLDDLSGGILLPRSNAGSLPVAGVLNLRGHRISIGTVPPADASSVLPLRVHVEAKDYLARTDWAGAVEFKEFSAPALLEVLKHFGATVPAGFAIEKGSVSGKVDFSRDSGVQGDVEIAGGEFQLPSGAKIAGPEFQFAVAGKNIALRAHSVAAAEGVPVIDGKYDMETDTLDVRVHNGAKGPASIAETALIAPDAPLLGAFQKQGTWRGFLRYVAVGEEAPQWTGQVEVHDAVVDVGGFNCPMTVSFTGVLAGERLSARGLRGSCGAVRFTGDYRYEPKAAVPHRLNLAAVDRWDLGQIENVLRPTLARGGFLSKTLRLGKAPVPEWLAGRKAEGTLRAAALTAGSAFTLEGVAAKYSWNGVRGTLQEVTAKSVDGATLSGEIALDLSGYQPAYKGSGSIEDVPVAGGRSDFDGNFSAEGLGAAALLSRVSAKGAFRAQSVRLNAEWLFDEVSGNFAAAGGSGGGPWPKIALSDLALTQGNDAYQGQGSAQGDGKLTLELTGPKRQLRLVGSLMKP